MINEVANENANCERCSFVSGNFFEKVPSGGDVYLLKSILHDWNDFEAKKILSGCHEVMEPHCRLIVIEPILAERNTPDYAKMMDVLMLNVTGGKERTQDDFIGLLKDSGFIIDKIIPTSTEFKMIIARPL